MMLAHIKEELLEYIDLATRMICTEDEWRRALAIDEVYRVHFRIKAVSEGIPGFGNLANDVLNLASHYIAPSLKAKKEEAVLVELSITRGRIAAAPQPKQGNGI